jgi:coenzyme F420 biosynthesis associated uncharacterized protein
VAFAQLIGRLREFLKSGPARRRPGPGVDGHTNRYLLPCIGFLLGFMGQRVLGQYDLALLSAEATPGRPLFVEENIRATARTLDVPLDAFRTWIALHETTHAFEFESHPWLRPYLAERLERQLAAFSDDLGNVSRDTVRQLGRVLRGERSGDHWLERLMTDEQRRLFRETQAVMSLLEGFSDYIMDEVGRDLVPDVERISTRFHARREQKSASRGRCLAAHRDGPSSSTSKKGERSRPGHRRARRGRRAPTPVGRPGRRRPARARSRRPRPGSSGSSGSAPAATA